MTAYVLAKKQYWKYDYIDWTQPVLTSNTSSVEITITDPQLSGGAFNESGEMVWGSSAVTNFSSIWKSMSSSTSDYFTVNKGAMMYTVFDVEFNALMKLSSIFIDGTVVAGYAAALTGSQIYSIDDKGNLKSIAFSIDNQTNTHTFDNVVVRKIRICVAGGSDSGTAPTRIKTITINAQKVSGSVKATKDDYDFTADKAYVFKRKRPAEYRKIVIDTATAGTYIFEVVKDTTARIILVGGGGAGGQVWSGHAEGSGGGSGACVYCKVKLNAGTYAITNGAAGVFAGGNAGNSILSLGDTVLITAGGGTGGKDAGGAAGVGGKYSFADNVEIENIIFASNGNNGTVGGNMSGGVGGASVYKGYGRGGNTRSGGNAGYIFVELTTDETDYDYKINNDKCYVLKRKQYWKYVYKDWIQPVLAANGTLGNNSFAVYTPNTIDNNSVLYNMFNENAGNVSFYDELPISIVFYNPNKLKVKSISLGQFTTAYWVKGVFQGCDDNASWVDIKTIDFNGTPITFDVNSEIAYKYHRFYITSSYSNDTIFNNIKITAQEQITVKATKDDYDFITD